MTRKYALLIGVTLTVACAALAVWAYPQAPPQVPAHWDASGHANGYMPRFWGLAIYPLLLLATTGMLVVLPAISPKGFQLAQSAPAFHALTVAVLAFEFAVSTAAIRAAVGSPMPRASFVLVGMGALFVVIGFFIDKVQKNFFVGIRTPWTLASNEVWTRTHRFGRWIFIAGGVLLALYGSIGEDPTVIVAIALLIAVTPIIYSYVVYRQIEGFGPNGP